MDSAEAETATSIINSTADVGNSETIGVLDGVLEGFAGILEGESDGVGVGEVDGEALAVSADNLIR